MNIDDYYVSLSDDPKIPKYSEFYKEEKESIFASSLPEYIENEFNKTALFRLPEKRYLRKLMPIFQGPCYEACMKSFWKLKPLFSKDYICESEIVEGMIKIGTKTVYYCGEINSDSKPHGIGLMIGPEGFIKEGHFYNGSPHKEVVYIEAKFSFSGYKITKFSKTNYVKGAPYGYLAAYDENARKYKEGYYKIARNYGQYTYKSRFSNLYCKFIGNNYQTY